MNYKAMTDFEVNKAVALCCGHKNPWNSEDSFNARGYDTEVYFGSYADRSAFGVDYCNDPSDAWCIILNNQINIDFRNTIKAGPMAQVSGNSAIYCVDENPLRAAMIVFLKMKGN